MTQITMVSDDTLLYRIIKTIRSWIDHIPHADFRRLAYQVSEEEHAQLTQEISDWNYQVGYDMPSDGELYVMGVRITKTLPNTALDDVWGPPA